MRPIRILLIEDSPIDAELIDLTLRASGLQFELRRVATERDCRRQLDESSWDIVLSDHMLPSFTGADALSLLRERCADTPFILISGYLGEEAAVEVMRRGANDFVHKSSLARLVPAIERELSEAGNRLEHRLTQDRIQARERLLGAIAHSINVGLLVVGPQARCQLVNPEAERLLARSAGSLVGHELTRVLPPEDVLDRAGTALATRAHGVIEGLQSSWNGEGTVLGADGERRVIACAITPFLEETGAQGVLIALRDITRHREREEEIKRSRERLRALSRHLTRVQERERVRLARELHDELGQMLLAVKLDAAWLLERCGGNPEVEARARDLLSVSDQIVDAVRRIAADLRPPMLDELGLVAALDWLTETFRERSMIACRFASEHEEYALSRDAATAVFRMVQEALTNVAKHAAARNVHVSLARHGATLEVKVIDDGRGFEYVEGGPGETFGLLGMLERAASVGGSLRCTTAPGAGCRLEFLVPLEKHKRPSARGEAEGGPA